MMLFDIALTNRSRNCVKSTVKWGDCAFLKLYSNSWFASSVTTNVSVTKTCIGRFAGLSIPRFIRKSSSLRLGNNANALISIGPDSQLKLKSAISNDFGNFHRSTVPLSEFSPKYSSWREFGSSDQPIDPLNAFRSRFKIRNDFRFDNAVQSKSVNCRPAQWISATTIRPSF